MSASTPNGGQPDLLRVAVIGASGQLGRELIDVLQERRFPIQELVPIATDRSLGESVDWLGHELPLIVESPGLRGLDLIWVCTPRAAALDWLREALRSETPCIDLSGAVAAQAALPITVADLPGRRWSSDEPVVISPAGPALMLAKALSPLVECGLVRVQATVVESASSAGRPGVMALQQETLALFQQREEETSDVFSRPLAFDCLPSTEAPGVDFPEDREGQLEDHLARALGQTIPTALTALRIPTFAGCGIQVSVEFSATTPLEELRDRLAKAVGLRVVEVEDVASTRSSIGGDDVLVGRLRSDPSLAPGLGLRFFLAADPLRLAALNALELARSRFTPGVAEVRGPEAPGSSEPA